MTICCLSIQKTRETFVLPSWSDNPGLEVVLLLAADTDGVTEVVGALGAGQLVSPVYQRMLVAVAVSPGLLVSQVGSVGKCWILIEVLQVRVASVNHQLLRNVDTLYSL